MPASATRKAVLDLARTRRDTTGLVNAAPKILHGQHDLVRRTDDSKDPSPGTTTTTIAIAVTVVGLVLLVAVFLSIRTLRARHPNPKYIPTSFLKNAWKNWKVDSSQRDYQTRDNNGRRLHMQEAQDNFETTLQDIEARRRNRHSRMTEGSGVNRNTSVRSVMTLPPYQVKAKDTEQVIGREGERDGIDMVVEMPTAEEEEAMRDEEMDALYQIREARRRQIEAREELRRERQEARDRRDVVAIEALRQQTREANQANTAEIEELRSEHERRKETRQRAVSSVSYAELGVQRADGTRLRASSVESERMGLLSDAASIALSQQSTGQSSICHRRDRSGSSAMSIDTMRSFDESPNLTGRSNLSIHSARSRSRAGSTRSRAGSDLTARGYPSRSATPVGSSPEMIDHEDGQDLADLPPDYDEVSLSDLAITSSHDSRSEHNASPYPDAPPNYSGPGPAESRNHRLSTQMEDLAAEAAAEEDGRGRRGSRMSLSRLPSLTLGPVPQIVVEPSSARPRDDSPERGRRLSRLG